MGAAFTERVLALPRFLKRVIVAGVDASLCILTVWIALYLRLGEWVSLYEGRWIAAAIAIIIAVPIFGAFGLYRTIFRYAGWDSIVATARACAAYTLVYAAVITAWAVPGVPRTLGLIQPALLLIAVAATRGVARFWLDEIYQRRAQPKASRTRVIIYGAGPSGSNLAMALSRSPSFELVCFVDDDPGLRGSVLVGARVYSPSMLDALVDRYGVTEILLALSDVARSRRNQIVEELRRLPVAVRTLPDIVEVAKGRVTVSDLRPLEIDDLLGREPVAPNLLLMSKNTQGKVIAITGAGGSIGSELCRQLMAFGPSRLLLIEMNEFALFAIHEELRRHDRAGQVELVPLLGSAANGPRMREIFDAWLPQTVYHAAAYKHVPIVEHNIVEGVWNNVFGTMATAIAARDAGVQNFVLISTDKAVRPTNVMGASKRLAEMVLQALAEQSGSTCFSMVRFGNVLGSSGSVVPLFREQIVRGGPVTITHPDITRYFMTVPEAAQLVIQAGAMAAGGDVFVLDMGDPVRIADLAQKMIELSGLAIRNETNPAGEIELKFVGLRPGEKLYEELLIGNNPQPTTHPRIMKANEHYLSWARLRPELETLREMIDSRSAMQVRELLCALVVDYSPDQAFVDYTGEQVRATAAE